MSWAGGGTLFRTHVCSRKSAGYQSLPATCSLSNDYMTLVGNEPNNDKRLFEMPHSGQGNLVVLPTIQHLRDVAVGSRTDARSGKWTYKYLATARLVAGTVGHSAGPKLLALLPARYAIDTNHSSMVGITSYCLYGGLLCPSHCICDPVGNRRIQRRDTCVQFH